MMPLPPPTAVPPVEPTTEIRQASAADARRYCGQRSLDDLVVETYRLAEVLRDVAEPITDATRRRDDMQARLRSGLDAVTQESLRPQEERPRPSRTRSRRR